MRKACQLHVQGAQEVHSLQQRAQPDPACAACSSAPTWRPRECRARSTAQQQPLPQAYGNVGLQVWAAVSQIVTATSVAPPSQYNAEKFTTCSRAPHLLPHWRAGSVPHSSGAWAHVPMRAGPASFSAAAAHSSWLHACARRWPSLHEPAGATGSRGIAGSHTSHEQQPSELGCNPEPHL